MLKRGISAVASEITKNVDDKGNVSLGYLEDKNQ
jgi:hypothetical protein